MSQKGHMLRLVPLGAGHSRRPLAEAALHGIIRVRLCSSVVEISWRCGVRMLHTLVRGTHITPL